jgi:hypothetical protein
MPPRSIAVLLEGDGDYDAIPLLIRNVAAAKTLHDLRVGTRPIKIGDAHSILKSEKFVRLFEYAITRDDIDAVIVTADCEDFCPVEAVQATYARVRQIAERVGKPFGVAFFCREYETMFLINANHIAPRSKSVVIDPAKIPPETDLLNVRNAKGLLKKIIASNTYKETRDQPRLTGAMEIDHCAEHYRPLRHLSNVVEWLYSWDGTRICY